MQLLYPIYEKQFSESSFDFRPRRSANDALKQCHVGYNYFLRWQKENVNAEVASMFIAYNIKQLLSMFKTKELVMKYIYYIGIYVFISKSQLGNNRSYKKELVKKIKHHTIRLA